LRFGNNTGSQRRGTASGNSQDAFIMSHLSIGQQARVHRHADLLVQGGMVLTPNGDERIDLACADGRMAALGDLQGTWSAETRLDATGLHVLPGVVDSQVHFREPGLTHKVDVLGSDHAPHTREEKAKPYPQSPSGMTGVQTLLPLMLDHLHAGRLSLQRLIDLTSAGPARIFGIEGKGRIALGYDADLTLVDLAAQRTIQNDWIASRSGWTPYDGLTVTGWPVHTVVRGQVVVRDEQLMGHPRGEMIRFLETPGATSLGV
jgi:dihydroorotase-like cyclic amidohydrolase